MENVFHFIFAEQTGLYVFSLRKKKKVFLLHIHEKELIGKSNLLSCYFATAYRYSKLVCIFQINKLPLDLTLKDTP